MKDGTRVLFVKFILGRDTLRKYPLNHDQKTNIFSTDIKWNGHGYLVEVIPAIFRFGRFYRIITMPDGSEKEGNLFFENRKYAMLNDTLYVRNGLSKYIEEIEKRLQKQLSVLQKSESQLERFFESFVS